MVLDETFVQGSLFEDDYLIRTLGPLGHSPDVAFTELVANAWDAGASTVIIRIPDAKGELLVIEDDGTGLTQEQFHSRWMKLGYNRAKHQGTKVEFPKGRTGARLAYGRNGVGRHGLLCFNDEYQVITRAEGEEWRFTITTHSREQPFVLKEESSSTGNGHGTRLEVTVARHLPDPDRIRDVVSARFLHDPQFLVRVNGKDLRLEDLSGLVDSGTVQVNGKNFDVCFVDTQKAARSTIYQGVAFWQASRLVGEPSWMLGKETVIDGRTRFAKRYTFVIKTSDLADQINEDWTGFKDTAVMQRVYSDLGKYIQGAFGKIAKENLDETKAQVRKDYHDRYASLSPLGKYEVDETVEHVVTAHPTATPETVGIAVEAVINLEQTRGGKELLRKLAAFSEEDVDGLNRLLGEWTIKDALLVLDEIDRRLSIVEAISKLSGDPEVDELHVLHPLVTEARWLFGPEFDSPEYASNRQLHTVAKKLFKVDGSKVSFLNEKKRPDLIMRPDSSVSVTGTESTDRETDLVGVDRILIVELKKGDAKLLREHRNQAVGYVEDFLNCKELTSKPFITAFVVGESIAGKVTVKQDLDNRGHVFTTTYSQLVDTARKRLFSLDKRLRERYDSVSGMELFERGKQMKLFDNHT
ncbi:MAG TPA: ATP-binding protein [Thermoguttaceae bacterium]|nr:ATP-binding protein [Thermoguttaceae bacterium]